jgi:putative hydroxymethylpyrimidine transport system substrate-binding protein
VPAYDELIFIAHRDRLGDPRLPRFLAAVERATLFMLNHPAEAWEDFRTYRAELDDELNKRAWADTLPRFAQSPAALDVGRYRRFAEFLKEQKLIPEVLPVGDYAVSLP